MTWTKLSARTVSAPGRGSEGCLGLGALWRARDAVILLTFGLGLILDGLRRQAGTPATGPATARPDHPDGAAAVTSQSCSRLATASGTSSCGT
jgi:hypothetical protein